MKDFVKKVLNYLWQKIPQGFHTYILISVLPRIFCRLLSNFQTYLDSRVAPQSVTLDKEDVATLAGLLDEFNLDFASGLELELELVEPQAQLQSLPLKRRGFYAVQEDVQVEVPLTALSP